MTQANPEFEELQARVSRIEAELNALKRGGMPTAPLVAEPPLLPPVLPRADRVAAALPVPKPRPETPSTVWVAGAGAVIFLIGAVYALTVSIQRGWISPPMRVGGGLVTGLAMGYWALRQMQLGRRGLGVALLTAGTGTWTFALYFGAQRAALFDPGLGLMGAAAATVATGWVAARLRSDGAMAVGLATSLCAPLAFSTGQGGAAGLMGYLAVLNAAQGLTHYLTGEGARWFWSRLLGTAGIWLVATTGVSAGRLDPELLTLGLLAMLAAGTMTLAWLPAHKETPAWPGAATVLSLTGVALSAWAVWARSGYPKEEFAIVLGALAFASAGLIPLARRRSDTASHDLPLSLLALGFGLLALVVACDWRWVVLVWGTVAALLAWAARAAVLGERPGAGSLQAVAAIAATAASAVWVGFLLFQRRTEWLFLNRVFAGGLLAAVAWALLAYPTGPLRSLARVLLQLVLVNTVAMEWSRALPTVHGGSASLAFGPLLATLTYAVVGAGLWLRGLAGADGKLLRLTGYGWLAVAGVKLLANDLARADVLFRAVAALGVGAVFIAAAWWAGRRRASG